MATAITTEANSPRARKPFAPRRPTDYNFFLVYVVLIWLAVLAGFIPDTIHHLRSNDAPYPIAVHAHAVVTIGWLALLTSQTLLIRRREVRLHRTWGRVGAYVALGVVILGFWAALAAQGILLDTPKSRPHFLAIAWSNIIEFAGLAAAAVIARNSPTVHKRLILLATLSLTPAAFNRAVGKPLIQPLLGSGVWQTWVQTFAPTDFLVLGIGIYDLLTRGRVHPAWAIGAVWILSGQLTASWLMYDPTWKVIATAILRTW